MEQQNPLDQLRDIHLPEAVGVWPLAPGWWILLSLCLVALGVLIWRAYRYWQQNVYRKLALAELDAEYGALQQHNDVAAYISANQAILRRAALQRYAEQRAAIAPLNGSAWIDFLDDCVDGATFKNRFGEQLSDAHYRRNSDVNPADLHDAARHWLRQHK